jgi:hypothetical protein
MVHVLSYVLSEYIPIGYAKDIMLVCKYWKDIMVKTFDPSKGSGSGSESVFFYTFQGFDWKRALYYLKFEEFKRTITKNIQNVCIYGIGINNDHSYQYQQFLDNAIHGITYGFSASFKRLIDAGLLKIPCCEKHCWLKLAYKKRSYVISDVFASVYKEGVPKEVLIDMINEVTMDTLKTDKYSTMFLGCPLKNGETVLTIAKYCNGDVKSIWKTLLLNEKLEITDGKVYYYMLCACKLGILEAIRYFHSIKVEMVWLHEQYSGIEESCIYGKTEALELLLSLGYKTSSYYKCIIGCQVPEKIKDITSILVYREEAVNSIRMTTDNDILTMIPSKHGYRNSSEQYLIYLVEIFRAFLTITPSKHCVLIGILTSVLHESQTIEEFSGLIETCMLDCGNILNLNKHNNLIDLVLDKHLLDVTSKTTVTTKHLDALFRNHKHCECMLPSESQYVRLLMGVEWQILSYIINVHSDHQSCWISNSKKLGTMLGRTIAYMVRRGKKIEKENITRYFELPKIRIQDFVNGLVKTLVTSRREELHQIATDIVLEVQCTGFLLEEHVIENIVELESYDIIIAFTMREAYIGKDKDLCEVMAVICGSEETECSITAIKWLLHCVNWFDSMVTTDDYFQLCMENTTKHDSYKTLLLLVEFAQESSMESYFFSNTLTSASSNCASKCMKVLVESSGLKRHLYRMEN